MSPLHLTSVPFFLADIFSAGFRKIAPLASWGEFFSPGGIFYEVTNYIGALLGAVAFAIMVHRIIYHFLKPKYFDVGGATGGTLNVFQVVLYVILLGLITTTLFIPGGDSTFSTFLSIK